MPPLYQATATVLIDPNQTEYTDLRTTSDAQNSVVWPAEMESYIRVLWSDQLASDVVEKVGVDTFQMPYRLFGPMRDWIGRTVSTVVARLQGSTNVASPAAVPGQPEARDADRLQNAIDVFHSNLVVERDGLAATLQISYRSPDPESAARVANAAAEGFPAELIRARKSSLSSIASYLGERVTSLREEVERGDHEAQILQSTLSKPDGSTMARLRFSELMRMLDETRGQAARLETDYKEATARAGEALSDRLSSPTLLDLRRQELQLGRDIAQLEVGFGYKHPQMAALQANHAAVRASIRSEEGRIRSQLENSLLSAKAHEASLNDDLLDVQAALTRSASDEIKLKQLQTSTDSTRQVYQDILARYVRASEQQLMLAPPARVLNAAHAPKAPERRKILLVTAIAIVGSLAVGLAAGLLAEIRRKGVRSSDELSNLTGQPVLALLPLIGKDAHRYRPYLASRNRKHMAFTESIRRLSLRIAASDAGRFAPADVILVSSAFPAEGKTLVSLSLARELSQGGRKVLIIDGDLRKRRLTRLVGSEIRSRFGLADLLASPSLELESAIAKDASTDVDLLLALHPAIQPEEALASRRMEEIIRQAKTRYQVVIIDTPPILAVSDPLILSRLVDSVLLVVRAQATPHTALASAINELRAFSDRPLGLVLNMVRLRGNARYTHSNYLAYHNLTSGYLK